MDVWNFATRYAWLIFLAVSIGNALVIRRKTEENVTANPALAQGYRRLLQRYLVVSTIPWVAMGAICLTAHASTLLSFLQPGEGNPYVLAWFALVMAIWAFETYWIFFNGGAQALVDHPGAYRLSLSRPWQVKLLWVACIAGGVAGMVFMWNSHVPFG